MSALLEGQKGSRHLLMGNEAIARGALEAGVSVAAGYPGTPSSEIIESLARVAGESNLYVEWSVNEKVAMEVTAAASFAGLRSLCVMKQNGVNVASDFLLHLAGSGTRAAWCWCPAMTRAPFPAPTRENHVILQDWWKFRCWNRGISGSQGHD